MGAKTQAINSPPQVPRKKSIKKSGGARESLYKKIVSPLLCWYGDNARALPWRCDREPYHVWLSEIMLQQTRVETVKDYYMRFLAALPTIKALASVDEQKLFKLWEGLGYYSRARNLQKAARVIVEKHGGVFPAEYETILSLPGIGEYTAGAVSSICFNQPVPAVDGNVLRVISRITENFDSVDNPAVKKSVAAELKKVYPAGRCGDFTQSLMELGATVCLPGKTPKCGVCPVFKLCTAYKNGTAGQLPVKAKRKPHAEEELTVFLLRCNNRIAVQKRADSGLLAGLFELPNVPGRKTAAQAVEIASNWGLRPLSVQNTVRRTHIFTHIKWHMTCYDLPCDSIAGDFIWVSESNLSQQIPLPTAFKMFINH